MSEDFAELFIACFKELRDEGYCRGVVETVAELAETRRMAYRGRTGITYVLRLPHNDSPHVLFAVDYRKKKGLILTLVGEGYITHLIYKRVDDKFRPIHAEILNGEIAAMVNHNMPGGVLQRLLEHLYTA